MDTFDVHVARILLVVDQISRESGALDGLTKLAKLDFLLRYPVFLEDLNERLGLVDLTWVPPRDVERQAIATPMVRYKYGPWDHKYYAIIGSLVGRGLVEYVGDRSMIRLRPTERGLAVASQLRRLPEWAEIRQRLDFLAHHYNISGTKLKDLIYESFPALLENSLGTAIDVSPPS